MLDTSSRLLRLLSLLQIRRFWTGAELAERLAITRRTLRRDIDRLRNLGYPIDGTAGVAGGYQLGSGAELPPHSLADDEALAVTIGLRTAASQGTGGIDEAALRALVKIERVMPERLRRRASALRASIALIGRAGDGVEPEILATIAAACDDHLELRFGYADHAGTVSERAVEPVGLVSSGRRWYLVAWDRGRDDWRTFRVDRAGRPVTGPRFAPRPPPAEDLGAYVSRGVSTRAYPCQARVVLAAPVETIAERVSPTSGTLERIDDQRCLLEIGAHSFELLGAWLCMLGVELEVVEPPELIDHLRALRARLDRAIG